MSARHFSIDHRGGGGQTSHLRCCLNADPTARTVRRTCWT
jgi:hypothetical protein